ncbi:MAG: endonuclease/exonuclease/phosphatase family protein [Planctomycetia bacterium]|nr:endonuclease/exonuclease/phosphatase family protein [Planctomycetia bacterium]
MRFQLVTYNIHKGIGGVDRRYRPERIVEALQHHQPDIVLLQEVDDGVPRSRHHRQVDLLGDALELPHRAYYSNVRLRTGVYGNAILSRFPLSDLHNIDLTIPLKKRRGAVAGRCHIQGANGHMHTLLLVNAHLGLAEFERKIQIRRILEGNILKGVHHQTAVIIAGDMNDFWHGQGRKLFLPAGFQSATGPIRTFPAFMPLRALDRIYYRGRVILHNAHASRTKVARRASDHLPLVADFEMT